MPALISYLAHSPADVVRWLLVALGLGSDPTGSGPWPVYAGGEPAEPDNVLTVYDTLPVSRVRLQVTGEALQHYGLQIRVRAVDHPTGWAKADQLAATLDQTVYAFPVRVSPHDYVIHSLGGWRILALGKDAPNSQRSLFTLNGQVSLIELD